MENLDNVGVQSVEIPDQMIEVEPNGNGFASAAILAATAAGAVITWEKGIKPLWRFALRKFGEFKERKNKVVVVKGNVE